ncbi:MAG: hypothetical protein ABI383_09120 [Acidobacteriaceae bacterium]
MNRIQAAKDSLYVALRDRLQVINPNRIALIGGTTRIAIAMEAALQSEADKTIPGVFYVSFGKEEAVADAAPAGGVLVKVECIVKYGAVAIPNSHAEADLSEMDGELLAAMMPTTTGLSDYSQTNSAALGDRVYWTMPLITDKGVERAGGFVLFVNASS